MLVTTGTTGHTSLPLSRAGTAVYAMAICDACRHDLETLLEQLYGLQVVEAEAVAQQLEIRQRIDAALDGALDEASEHR